MHVREVYVELVAFEGAEDEEAIHVQGCGVLDESVRVNETDPF